MTMFYEYQTFPGQTIVRTCVHGYTFEELLAELRLNGEGIILASEEGTDDRIAEISGKACDSL